MSGERLGTGLSVLPCPRDVRIGEPGPDAADAVPGLRLCSPPWHRRL